VIDGAARHRSATATESIHSPGRGRLRPGRWPARAERQLRVGATLVGAASAALFAQATIRSDLQTHSLIGAVFCIEQVGVVIAYLARRRAQLVTHRWGDWLLAFGGTFGGVLFRPGGIHPHGGVEAGLWAQLLGLVIAMASFLALGRSFGFAAADRGLATRGPYAVVRHPIYSSYLLLQAGYLLQSISIRNAVVMLFASGCNVGRALVEERLRAPSEEYATYRSRVRWRLIPGIW
jgi:protein-S-isoprenylcysteine O-methyltransferase Ste14